MMRLQQRARPGLVTLAAILFSACSGVEDSGDSGATENSFAPQDSYSEGDIDHLLMRAEFGIEVAHREVALSVGYEAYVDQMLAFPTSGVSAVEATAANFLVNSGDPAGLEGKFPSRNDISDWWIYLMMHTEYPFQERLALFWHDHFAVSYSVFDSTERHMIVDYIQRLRTQGTSNFKTLALELSRDSAMLEWLNGNSNTSAAPNENFAREFFELFTVGVDRGYTEDDVQEAARAFTGYRTRLDANGMRYHEFDTSRKDMGEKVLFGNVILVSNGIAGDDYDLVVDAAFAHLDVASWLAEKLSLEFITSTPNAEMIANLAKVIRDNSFDMTPILRTLFLSQAFVASQGDLVRMPISFGIGTARSTGLRVSAANMRNELNALEQLPGDPPTVFGWPQGDAWFSSASMVERANLVRRLIADRSQETTDGLLAAMPVGAIGAAEVVDHFAALCGVELTAQERITLIEYLDSDVQGGGVIQPDPFDPTDAQDISNRVRGLLYILANHPGAHRN